MKVYISGPISKRPNTYKAEFARGFEWLRIEGHVPVSPVDVSPYSPEKTWLDYMRDDIPAMLQCDAVAVLPGWLGSRGARIEVILAWALGMKIIRLKKE